MLANKTAVFVGQSGVGKSSLLNALSPGLDLRVGVLSVKHDRGNHTTNFSILITLERACASSTRRACGSSSWPTCFPRRSGSTSGISPLIPNPAATSPVFTTTSLGCAVMAAVERGEIHPDRYESYLRILHELRETAERKAEHG